ncbi:FxsA family protein [Luminiphilus sp.]|jgi:UPF0716 protein FxsA|nr:FxsA family protein [Luminiphilus sp.]MDB2313702.1 FxsA family protein [Luminiphilus sp.]MDB2316917.1 FxsA family protein [Luminiphilus sp.]MDB2432769.1 FxsA family protein [Luminiphilus sp.]MDB2511792.1 FxsA family protein [Luminiphilus sp.]
MPLLLIAFPFLEFWTLLELSARAGALATMGYIVFMIVVGYWLLQWAGRSALMTAGRFTSASAIRGQLFAGEISVAFGAVLLMIPGVISDVLALYIFSRAAFRALVGGSVSTQAKPSAAAEPRDIPHGKSSQTNDRGPITLEGDFSRLDDE